MSERTSQEEQGQRRTVSLRALEIGVAGSLLVVGALAMWGAAAMPKGTARLPGPGFAPTILGAVLAAAAIAVIVSSVRAGPERDERLALGHWHITLMVIALIAAALLFEPVGFVVTTALFLFVLLKALSPLDWWRSAVTAVAAAFVAKQLFQTLLSVSLPPFPFALF
jgi:putative tricarboxylic transport membrane protein